MNAAERYMTLSGRRTMALYRAVQYASWTIPATIMRTVAHDIGQVNHDWQGVGSRGTIHLVNKLMEVMFPSKMPFFKLAVQEDDKKDYVIGSESIELELARLETLAIDKMNSSNLRSKLQELLILLVISGDGVLKVDLEEGCTVYQLAEYVKTLSPSGRLNELIIEEKIYWHSLPEDLQKQLMNYENGLEPVKIYTWVKRKGKKYTAHQEIIEIGKIGATGTYTEDTLPWICCYWRLVNKENYGRGLIELHAGDFASLSNTAESIAVMTAILADFKHLVSSKCASDVQDLLKLPTGGYTPGEKDDVTTLWTDVSKAIEVLTAAADKIERRLGAVFLLNSAVTRDKERVTAEEIRVQVAELEAALGGVYSSLGNALQRPLATRLLGSIDTRTSKLKMTVLTGLESLSRTNEIARWSQLLTMLATMANTPPEAMDWINFGKLVKVLSAGFGLDYNKVLNSEEEVKAVRAERLASNQP